MRSTRPHGRTFASKAARMSASVALAVALCLPAPALAGIIEAGEGMGDFVPYAQASCPMDVDAEGGGMPVSGDVPEGTDASLPEGGGDGDVGDMGVTAPGDDPSDDRSDADGLGGEDVGEDASDDGANDPSDGDGPSDDGDAEEDADDPSDDEDGEGAQASARGIDASDPEQMEVLIGNRFTGLTPANTTVNLFDYTSYMDEDGNDEQASSAPATDWLGSADDPNVNTGHMLTFGNGMNNGLGYWNAGSGSGMGDFSKDNPGFQNIVGPLLGSDGYPALSTSSMAVQGYSRVDDTGAEGDFSQWPLVGGYASNPALYADAKRVNASWSNGQPCFPKAGGANVSDAVRAQWDGNLSLAYLFDPSQAGAPGRTETHTDVGGLFQLVDGYYSYDMRKNFAQYTPVAVEGRDGTIPANSFILYDEPAGLRTDGTDSIGNFLPFDTGEEVFKVEDGRLESDVYATNSGAPGTASNQGQGKAFVNHNLGLSMETSFRQPVGGTVGDDPMTFEFIGDDDLWVFIDDVLVLDLGGIHSELYGTIDFSTGEVALGTAFSANGDISAAPAPVRKTTIKDMFEAAGVDASTGFKGDTFSSNTSHTLKMFYLERGNYDSSLSVRFNLQPQLFQQVRKVDQEGDPVAGVTFDLYPVASTTAATPEAATLDDVVAGTAPLASMVTGADGIADVTDAEGEPFNFADRVDGGVASRLYVLRERSAPAGYRMMPIDVLMRYDQETGTFVVNNRYDTGSYASFNSYVTEIAPERLSFGSFDAQTGTIASSGVPVPASQQEQGLVVAIPTLKQGSSTRWDPLYGANNSSLHSIPYDQSDVGAMREALLEAVLCQAYLSKYGDAPVPGWHMSWTDEGRLSSYSTQGTSHVTCTLSDLPGNPTRYRLNDADGDMQMVYGVVSSAAFTPGMTSAERYASLASRVKARLGGVADPTDAQLASAAKAVARDIASLSTPGASGAFATRGFSAIEANDPDVFERNFRSLVNVPNEQRELRVWKVDEEGARVNGAAFALFESKADAERASGAVIGAGDVVTRVHDAEGNPIATYAAGVTGDLRGSAKHKGDDLEGMLIFAPYVENGPGGAKTLWTQDADSQNGRVLYLKEVAAPKGFEPNEAIVPVVIGQYGIYADAGVEGDGVEVLAGVGKLAATMTKYAASPNVNLTLRYVTSVMQSQPSTSVPDGAQSVPFDSFNASWQDAGEGRRMDLEYGVNALVDYGSPDGFTDAELEEGTGYVDAEGNVRPLFVTDTGFVRATAYQDTDAVVAARAQGAYEGVNADLLAGKDLTNLFSIRNTVRVTDAHAEDPDDPDDPKDPDDPGKPDDPDTPDDPEDPEDPDDPDGPDEPGDPGLPDDPATPAFPGASTSPGTPTGTRHVLSATLRTQGGAMSATGDGKAELMCALCASGLVALLAMGASRRRAGRRFPRRE